MKKKNSIRLRKDIQQKYKWRLEDVYETEENWLNDYLKVENMAQEIKKYKNTLSKSATNLFDCLQLKDKMFELRDKVYMYALQQMYIDSKNIKSQLNFEKAQKFKANIEAQSSFIEVEIIKIPVETLFNYKNDLKELRLYDFYFEKLIRQKLNRLSEVEENILNKVEYLKQSPENIYNKLNNVDILREYKIEDENGNKITIKSNEYEKILSQKDRNLRVKLFKEKNKYFMERKYTLAEIYSSVVKNYVFSANIRNYNSSVEYALFNENIPVNVYNNLILTVRKNLNIIHKFISIYKNHIGITDFHIYDFNVSIIDTPSKKIPYSNAIEILKDCLSVFGEEYVNTLNEAFNLRWVDVYENDGKKILEGCSSIYGSHAYVLMNYRDDIRSILTLAHEMGHALNSYYAFNEQPYVYAYYVPFLSEIASQVNEILLLEYMIKNAKDKDTQIYLIFKYLKRFYLIVINQTKFAEFEEIIHERCKKGESISFNDLCKTYHSLNQDYDGPEMIIDEDYDIGWAKIPHIFRTPFYVYSYATGYSAAIAIAAKINQGDKNFINTYLDFLKKGGSNYPIDIIKTLGIDLTTSGPIQSAFDKFKELLNNFEELLNSK